MLRGELLYIVFHVLNGEHLQRHVVSYSLTFLEKIELRYVKQKKKIVCLLQLWQQILQNSPLNAQSWQRQNRTVQLHSELVHDMSALKVLTLFGEKHKQNTQRHEQDGREAH